MLADGSGAQIKEEKQLGEGIAYQKWKEQQGLIIKFEYIQKSKPNTGHLLNKFLDTIINLKLYNFSYNI
jgi:hypothetical protein